MTNPSSTMQRTMRACAFSALATLLLAGVAFAGQPTGISALEGLNMSARTVTLRGETYRVTDSTRIMGTKGEPTQLDQLKAAPAGAQLIEVGEADTVKWKAVSTPKGWVLTELSVLEAMPD